MEAAQKITDIRLTTPRFKNAEYERVIYVATVEPKITMDDILDPSFWAYVEPNIKPYDKIEVRTDDSSFYAELLVLSKGKAWVKCKVISHIELNSETKQSPDAQYEAKWKGPHLKFCVVRKSDGEVIEDTIPDKEDAIKRAGQIEKEIG